MPVAKSNSAALGSLSPAGLYFVMGAYGAGVTKPVSVMTLIDKDTSDVVNGGAYVPPDGNDGFIPIFRWDTDDRILAIVALRLRVMVTYAHTVAGSPASIEKAYDLTDADTDLNVATYVADGFQYLRSGTYTLTLTAMDAAGHALNALVIKFTVANPPGTLTWISPTQDDTLFTGSEASEGTMTVATTVTGSFLPSNYSYRMVHGEVGGPDSAASPQTFAESDNNDIALDFNLALAGRIAVTATDLDGNTVGPVTVTFGLTDVPP